MVTWDVLTSLNFIELDVLSYFETKIGVLRALQPTIASKKLYSYSQITKKSLFQAKKSNISSLKV